MGCSPSKGKLLLKPEQFGIPKALVTEVSQEGVDCGHALVEDSCLKPQDKKEDPPLLTHEHCTKKTSLTQLDSDLTLPENALDIKEAEVNELPQEIISHVMQKNTIQKTETHKKNVKKRSTERQRKTFAVQTKVNFPPLMVRAHQAAYSFLNPNISKYETLLGLLDQATQTQLSLQPIISVLGLYFEEINQALEEMAEEGELMLKEHGDSMTLPSGMLSQAVRSATPSTTTVDNCDPPPDLLQQLLQQSSKKMRQVGSSVKTLGDTTLEEAIEYFCSLSKLFAEKLQAKQAAEQRLSQVLARVEAATIKMCNLEDSALHSEDSGIGGENESLTGSERHQCHRGSAGSGSCGSEVNIQGMFRNYPNNLAEFVSYNKDDKEGDKEEEEKYEDDESYQGERKRSSSSLPDPSPALRYMHVNSKKDQKPTFKQLFPATKMEHFSSSSYINVMTELQTSQKDFDQKIKTISETRGLNDFVRPHYNLYQAGVRRHSLDGSAGVQKSQARTNQPPCILSSLPLPPNQPLKRHSVRRLINTFSHGVDERPGPGVSHISPQIMRPNKSCILLPVSNIVNSNGEYLVNGNNSRSCPDSRDDLDMDNLPPPPLEVLMDNSFQHNESQQQNEKIHEDPVLSLPLIHQNTGISQRKKIALQNVEILPNKANVKPRSMAVSPAPPVRQEGLTEVQHKQLRLETEALEKTEKTNRLHQQATKIIHLCNAGESFDKKNILVQISGDLTTLQATNNQRFEGTEILGSEMPPCNLPIIAPPVSRVRLPPSCPSVRHSFPSPPMFRPHSNSRSSSRSNSPRTVTRADDNITEQIIPSVSFHDARSVFCQNELQSSQACLSFGSSALPKKWGEVTRGRLLIRERDNLTRRTQSEQRPQMISHSEFEIDDHLVSLQTKEDEPVAEK
ncbi:hypothetical protein GOODEAATRI_015145 [Goodea atripinnis]|uniref:Photoreceptor cilium actin regulator n=1 Tax=Goodea atripinnis TaxID=208336 RepID=A0ABV0NMX6_9TELE